MPHVTFIHGIANKPPKEKLLEDWESALASAGLNLPSEGVTTSMVYWADVMYAEPSSEENSMESAGENFGVNDTDEDLSWVENLSDEERKFVESFRDKLGFDAELTEGDDQTPTASTDEDSDITFEAIPLPGFIKRKFMKRYLKDVHHYLFNASFSPRPGENFQVQNHIRNLFIDQLKQDSQGSNGQHIVVGHSMGTVISYDCLKNTPNCPSIDGYMTIGCPLGLSEVHKNFNPKLNKHEGFPSSTVLGNWVNVYDRFDPVALDARIAGDYQKSGQKVITDQKVSNTGAWRHSSEKYFRQAIVADHLKQLLKL